MLSPQDTHEVEVTLHLRVSKTMPERQIDRLRMALVTVGADMDGVIEAGVDAPAALKRSDLEFLWNEVQLAGPIVRGIDTGGIFERLTCTEANALADIFTAAGDQRTAEFIITEHGYGDDDCDDMHHNKDTCEHDHEEDPNAQA